MKQIKYRDLLRNPKLLFPIPPEGIEIVRQDGNFYIVNKASELLNVSDKVSVNLGSCQFGNLNSYNKFCNNPAIKAVSIVNEDQEGNEHTQDVSFCEKHYEGYLEET